jgi:hypothetical protein
MKKNDVYGLLGLALMVGGLIWMAILTYPYIVYKYDHPELTETQLELRTLGMFRLWHLIPVGTFLSGMTLLVKAAPKR